MEVFEKLARKYKIFLIDKVLSYYIQDSENRAMLYLPEITKTYLYQLDSSKIINEQERIYQKNRLTIHLINYLVKCKVYSVYRLLKKHSVILNFTYLAKYFTHKLGSKLKYNSFLDNFF